MKDEHQHCPCNGVLLCSTCHKDVHANPFGARAEGFIVSRHEAEPGGVLVKGHYTWMKLSCDGNFEMKEQSE